MAVPFVSSLMRTFVNRAASASGIRNTKSTVAKVEPDYRAPPMMMGMIKPPMRATVVTQAWPVARIFVG